MSDTGPGPAPGLEQRREVFRTVVESQDRGTGVAASRADAARQFGLTVAQVEAIEREGLANEWPPL